MKPIHVVYAVSLGFHVVAALLLDRLKPEKQEEIVNISMTTIEQPKEEEKPKPPDPEPEPVAVAKPVPRAAPQEAPPPAPTEAAPPAPDFGFVMSSGGGGSGGIAVAAAAPPPPKVVTKKVLAAAPSAAPEDTCGDADTKPKATSMPHPAYTEEARAAAIEGKVRVELTLTPEGTVADAKVIEGLGHGLDEAAIAALREAKFQPATHCGKPVAATFTVSVRFTL